MQAYQAGIAKFEQGGNKVFGISTDDLDTLKRWSNELNLSFPLLSDPAGKVAEAYSVLIPGQKLAWRVTFVIDREGKIQHVEQGSSAIDPTGAVSACSRLHAK